MSNRLVVAMALTASLTSFLLPQTASAARVLFVSDGQTDLSIETVLRHDGHDLTIVENDFFGGQNPSFHGDLSIYDCIVWSATNDGSQAPHTDTLALSQLATFAQGGGDLFVTGNGAVGYGDAELITLLGGTSGASFSGAPQVIADLDTELTTGVIDLRGVIPDDHGQFSYEALVGLGADTTPIVLSMSPADGAQWSIRSIGDGHIAWVAALEGIDDEWTNTASGPAGAFNGALRNFVAASTGTASAPGAPRVAFDAPFLAAEGDAITITTRVTDAEGDTTTFSWDVDHDGTYGEHPGEPSITIPAGTTDGPSTLTVAVEASDGTHTSHRSRAIAITNVAPHITSHPPMIAAIDQHIRYQITTIDPGGAHDVPMFLLENTTSSAVVTDDGIFDWTPNESEISAPGTSRPFAVDVSDGDGGSDTQTWSMMVIDDHAPSGLALLYPTVDEPLLVRGIHFAIANASDVDGDPITYTFEIASNTTFDADRQRSTPQAEGLMGITEWRADESQLHVGHWFWRVTATDGQVTTSPVTSNFSLVPDPSTFPDAAVFDAGPDASTGAATSRGCGCGVAHPDGALGPSTALLAVITMVVLRARRRR